MSWLYYERFLKLEGETWTKPKLSVVKWTLRQIEGGNMDFSLFVKWGKDLSFSLIKKKRVVRLVEGKPAENLYYKVAHCYCARSCSLQLPCFLPRALLTWFLDNLCLVFCHRWIKLYAMSNCIFLCGIIYKDVMSDVWKNLLARRLALAISGTYQAQAVDYKSSS